MAAKRSRAKDRAGGARSKPSRASGGAASSSAAASGRASVARAGAGVEARVQQIQRLIDVMVAAGAVEVEVEEAGSKVRVRLREDRAVVWDAPKPAPAATTTPAAPLSAGTGLAAGGATVPVGGEMFRSPLVGTFYRSPSPDSDPFVRVGDRVVAEQTICIIEAMKVMNEIKAEEDAEIVEILAQNGEAVEYGQPLFVLRKL